ncbi:ArnT family glycosyltransferase [Ottowia sp.]|uniref:ArnT family glycosyltransferase n=1 Tax=Ottowia sp. TaxID=1898956 RepID=UPI003A8784D8
MSDAYIYAMAHWAMAGLFLLAAYGLGSCLTRIIGLQVRDMHATWLEITAGAGLLICIFLGLAWAGHLRVSIVWLFIGLAAAAGLVHLVQACMQWRTTQRGGHPIPHDRPSRPWQTLGRWAIVAIVVPLSFPLLVAPLRPPYVWDEVMYHLPHAREWAVTGHLTVNEWLRYPWSPMGMSLLYAAALLVQDDVLPHLLNAAAGFGCALLIWSFRHWIGGWAVGLIASLLWLQLAAPEFPGATADLGLSLFVTASVMCVLRWIDDKAHVQWLFIASFLGGCALSMKYQALIFVAPLVCMLVYLLVRRQINWRTIIFCAILIALPCIYWFARNWLETGNPFNPLASSILGYYDWSESDMAWQLEDLRRSRNWPHLILWPAVLGPLSPGFWKSNIRKALYAYALYAFFTWLVTSHYSRYLLPAVPVLLLLSISTLIGLIDYVLSSPSKLTQNGEKYLLISKKIKATLFVLAIIFIAYGFDYRLSIIPVTESQKRDFLLDKIHRYEIIHHTKQLQDHKVYQWGMEGMIYYFPRGTKGDFFGPWRYFDMPFEPANLSKKLKQGKFDYLATSEHAREKIEAYSNFNDYFETIAITKDASIYRIK